MAMRHVAFVVLALAVAATGAPVDSVVIDNPDGSPPYNLQSATVGAYTVGVADLRTGTSTGGSLDTPNSIGNADNFDLNSYSARNTPGDVWEVRNFGGLGNWSDWNGADVDFFIFEAASGGYPDTFAIQAILPGGTLGTPTPDFVPADWGDTGYNTVGGKNNNQDIKGFAFAVTDLLDDVGAPLTNSSVIEGLRINSGTVDPSLCAAAMPGAPTPAPQALIVNVDLGTDAGVFSGQGVLLDPGNDFWNSTNSTNSSLGPLVASDGSTPTTITFSSSGVSGEYQTGKAPDNDLIQDYFHANNTIADFILGGLDPNAFYELLLYGTGDNTDQGSIFTIIDGNGTYEVTTLGRPLTEAYELGNSYVVLGGLIPDGSNQILGSWTSSGGQYGGFNGFQLRQAPADVIPEPATLSLLALGGLALLRRRRRS